MIDLVEAKQNINIKLFFTRGHKEDFGNSKADELARQALALEHERVGALIAFNQDQQLKDPAVRQIHAALTDVEDENNQRFDNFKLKDGLLYHKQTTENGEQISKLVVPADQRDLKLRFAHDDQLYGGHLVVRKTLKNLRS